MSSTTEMSSRFILRIAWIVLLAASAPINAKSQNEGLRIDVARDGRIKIENKFGDISVEVWTESYVQVSANIGKTAKAFVTSPIVIDNRNNQLLISVVRRPIDPPAVIDLEVKIPESSHLAVETVDTNITLRGMPQSATLTSASGEVRALLPPANADVLAKSDSGNVVSDWPAATVSGAHNLALHLGNGGRNLQIDTRSGAITVGHLTTSSASSGEQSQPVLAGTSGSNVAGSPATPDNEEISEGDVVRVDAQLVTLNMSVIDRSTNRGVLGLGQKDFTMFEDGVEQQILQFDAASAPFDLFLVVDLSGSTKDVLKLIRAAALRFIDAARPLDRIGVVTFAGKSTLVSNLTLDRSELRNRVQAIETAAGDTKLYDAVNFTIEEIARERTRSRRTAIVLMSDGLDGSIPGVQGDGSKLAYKELRSRVQEFDGVLYTLWLNTEYEALNPLDTQPEAFDAGHDRMKELADDGGGIFYEVESLDHLAGAYEHVVADLGTVYSLAYRPTNKSRNGQWRALRVVVNRPNAIARGKRGYYAN